MAGRSFVMSRLNDRQRVILLLSLNGLPDRIIAAVLNTSRDSIKTSRLKALKCLSGEIEEGSQVQAV